MATFSAKDFSADNYSDFRPTYPDTFFEYLAKWAPDTELAVDLGCGTGVATTQVSKYVAKKTVGVDPSEAMIKTASRVHSNDPALEFRQGSDLDLVRLFEPQSIDLITVAEAAHWLKYPDFFESASKVLKPNGKIAIWAYIDPVCDEFPQLRQKLEEISYDPKYFGNYWDKGRFLLNGAYKEIKFPASFKVEKYDLVLGGDKDYESHPFKVERTLKVGQFVNFVRTYSSYHTWKAANPGAKDIVDQYEEDLAQIGLTPDKTITLRWDTVLILASKV